MTTYVCNELATNPNIYGEFACKQWVVQENLLDTLAITPVQAGELAVAICTIMFLGWLFGEIGHFIKSMR